MIKFAIVDDEHVIATKIEKILNVTLFNMDIEYKISIFTDAKKFIRNLELCNVDIVILDIEINDFNGIEIAKYIKKHNEKIIVIYVTAHINYIRESFGLNVFDYITKPEMKIELPKTIINLIEEVNENYILTFIADRKKINVNTKDIKFIKYYERKVVLETIHEIYDISTISLKQIYNDLNKNFVFIDNGSIVNLEHVKSINDKKVTLHTSETYSISSRKYKIVKGEFNDYLISNGRKWI